ncbi:MAG: D-alanine--D-alanine ligase [Lachnospiraceae bacterium]|nr:D-alanine--D-alanine ligase [Lachnospiraceae bacterium]
MKLNIAIVFGGKSTEHEVSVISALQAIENIDKDKYNIIAIYMDKKGDFYFSKDNLLTDSKNYKNINSLLSKCNNVYFVKEKNHTYLREVNAGLFGSKLNQTIDVAFPIVHGTNVEDGNLQGYFHTLNLPIVGPDTLSSAVSMDKYVMKEYCKAIGIPVIEALRFDKNDYKEIDKLIKRVKDEIGFPVIVKPVNLGSSIGIKKATDESGLRDALELAFSFADIILIEKAITNLREINCAVLGDKFDAECSALEEPFGHDEILSFADKYMGGGGAKGGKVGTKSNVVGTKSHDVGESTANLNKLGAKSGMASLSRKVPADLDEATSNEIKSYAKKIFKYIGCSGVARIDFIIDKDTKKVYANEINSIPGSLAFYLFQPLGMEYRELLDKLINIAIENYKDQERLNFSFENNLLA